MPSHDPQIARLRHWVLGSRRRVVGIGQPLGLVREQRTELELAEAGQRQVEARELCRAAGRRAREHSPRSGRPPRPPAPARPAPFLDARRDGRDLRIRMCPGISRVRDQPLDPPTLPRAPAGRARVDGREVSATKSNPLCGRSLWATRGSPRIVCGCLPPARLPTRSITIDFLPALRIHLLRNGEQFRRRGGDVIFR
jgi:hypothetical protein